jgi:carbonic anhydrase
MPAAPVTGAEALDRLLAGNERFVRGGARETRRARLGELVEGQSPFAVILSCSDSRVPAEIVFDQDLGDVFLVRVAGNTATDPILLGSIEYGVGVLGAVLLMVLGHERCGAVTAALDHLDQGTVFPGDVQAVVDPVLPAARAASGQPGERRLDHAVRENVRRQVALLGASPPVLAPAVSAGRLVVVGARYALATGRVEVIA